ncbi:MAG TPA: rhodanese-like domain-containing protein [Phycisphaerae bacterium]|nr:rhodanese-like domain-containing protein [Phycisphaerae bacterium]
MSTYPPATSPPAPAPRAQRPGPKVRLLSPRQAQEELRSKGDVFLLCVAGKEDYDRGHIAGSVLIPATALRHGLEKNILYPEINRGRVPRKGQPVVFYCWWKTCECPDVPTFSDYAAKVLIEKGYTDLGMIDGGMRAWAQAKLPVERAGAPSMK